MIVISRLQGALLTGPVLVALAASCLWGQSTLVPPPDAKTIRHVDTVHGEVLIDNYYWMREKENPEVIAYLEAENAYTDTMMSHTADLQETLYEEMLGRIKETDLSVPAHEDGYYYYYRTVEEQQYRIYCRKTGSLEAPEEILLDLNDLAEGRGYLALGTFSVSPDHSLLAYSLDTTGNEQYTLYIKNLATDSLFSETVSKIGNAEWANDNRTIFYTVEDSIYRPYQVYRHLLGTRPGNDELVYHEKDDGFYLYLQKTKNEKYLIINSSSMVTSEVRYLDAEQPEGEFRIPEPRQYEIEYSVEHQGERFLIVTNRNAKNFKLVESPVSKPAAENWVDVIAHSDTSKIDGIDVFRDYLVVYERVNGLRTMRVRSFFSNAEYYIDFPEPVYVVYGANNPDFSSKWVRFTYMSLVTPRSVYDYNMSTRERELKKQTEVLGGYNPDDYGSERIFAVARDGVRVPVSLVYRKGTLLNGESPLLLYGYGAYGISMDPYFSSNRVSLLDRGIIYAIAHIRGGGEMGRQWYEEGKFLKKKNTFTDFIDCADHLVQEQYTSHDKLVISGGSAGGLLIGAVVNMRPDLAAIAIAEVPFVDVLNTMLDSSIPLTVIEYDEWGNPNQAEYFEYMRSYSPYGNVARQSYPAMLIQAGLNDARVQYWEPAKWVAKLRDHNTGAGPILLKMNMGTGHGGASGRYDYLREIAFEYAFILDNLGLTERK